MLDRTPTEHAIVEDPSFFSPGAFTCIYIYPSIFQFLLTSKKCCKYFLPFPNPDASCGKMPVNVL